MKSEYTGSEMLTGSMANVIQADVKTLKTTL